MPATESDLTELFIRSFKCTGDVPPALVGSSVTYLNGYAYVFGGRALHSGKLSNDMFACNLREYHWRRIETSEAPVQPQNDVESNNKQPEVSLAPSPRFFHSATAFQHYLIVFGGMGLDTDPDAPGGPTGSNNAADSNNMVSSKSLGGIRSGSIQDDRNQQSFQVRTSKTLLGDIAVFDTQLQRWVSQRALDSSGGTRANDTEDAAANTTRPSPRYAHLSTLLGSRLLVVGGQDLEEQYVEELNVFDLQLGKWVLRSPFPRAVGLYRSFITNVPSTGSTLLYSNYSFASVKRALYLLSAPPDCTLKEISDQLDGEPPGLRFPRGHLVDPSTIIMSGTLISTEGHSEMSLWALNTKSLSWEPVNCGAKFRAGSWNQSVVDPRTNTLVLFGDSRRDLTYDYQRRRLNYSEIRAVDLRALGYLRTPQAPELPLSASSSPLAAARSAATGTLTSPQQQHQKGTSAVQPMTDLLGFEVGSQLLSFAQFNDAEVIGSDGNCVMEVNSGLLSARWPEQTRLWLSQPCRDSATDGSQQRTTNSKQSSHRPESSLISDSYDTGRGESTEHSDLPAGARRFIIDGSCEVIYLLMFYLYTGVIDPSARFGLHQGAEIAAAAAPKDDVAIARVLGELLVLSRKYSLDTLALRTTNMLRWKVTVPTAPLIFEAALRADHHGLQARCVLAIKDHVGGLRADRQSTLYMVSSTARASILRFFPKLDADTISTNENGSAQNTQYGDRIHQNYQQQPGNAFAPDLKQHADIRQRSPSDALLGAATDSNGSVRGAFPSPQSSGGSPAATLRGNNQGRSPYQQHELSSNPRRPWESAVMASPVINSPVSSRYSGQSPEIRSGNGHMIDNKRLSSGISHLSTQPLPEDIPINYGPEPTSMPNTAASDSTPHSSKSSKRASRYLGGIGSNTAASSVDSVVGDRRTSDSSSTNDTNINHQQYQQQQQLSSRSIIFRPWSKMKKIASSSQVGSDSLPPIPSHSSSYSGNSGQ
ncbi:hypothetical protein H4S08_003654 [Coemansia sp. RSA 1365]|nr:hypothetical protein H4S08_003654 [Coemansia sp. RSA 1365]